MVEKTGEKKSFLNALKKGWKAREEEKRPRDKLNASLAFDALLASVGNGGKWQIQRGLFLALMGSFTAFHNLGAIFLGATPDFACDNPYLPEESVNQTVYNEILNYTTPWVKGNKGVLELSSCQYYDRGELWINESLEIHTQEGGGTSASNVYHLPPPEEWEEDPPKVDCTSWIYNQSVFTTTVVTEWDLVCDKAWLKPTIQASYMMGILTGAVAASGVSDRFGRRIALLGCVILFFSCSVIAAFSTSLVMFLIFRFILGGAGQGITLIKFVMAMETSGKKNRDFYGNLNALGWMVGSVFLVIQAYFIRDWRTLQLVMGSSIALSLLMYWIIPESPRWSLMNGRTSQGLATLEQIGNTNGGKLPEKEELEMYLDVIKEDVLAKRKKEERTCLQGAKEFFQHVFLLVKTPNMRRRNLIMFYNWFVVSMCYYGAAFSGENISVSLYGLSGLAAASEVGVVSITYFSAIKLGRRTTLCYTMMLSGVSLVVVTFVPSDLGWLNLILVTLARMLLGIAFWSVFFFSSELVPTDIRNISMGISSMWARIGSAIGPYIVDLLGAIYYAIPSTVFGVLAIVAGLLALLLPETAKNRFPETIKEIELMPR